VRGKKNTTSPPPNPTVLDKLSKGELNIKTGSFYRKKKFAVLNTSLTIQPMCGTKNWGNSKTKSLLQEEEGGGTKPGRTPAFAARGLKKEETTIPIQKPKEGS